MTAAGPDRSWSIPGPGETLAGKYVIGSERGRGGLAVVLSAVQIDLDRLVTVKMLLPEWAADRSIVERFVREGRAATRVTGEHVVRVLDVGTSEQGAPYLVLEYVEGHSMDEVVRTWGPLPAATAVDWLLQAAEAVAEGHARGIVHHDLRSANLFLTQRSDGTVCIKVIDFGLSKITDPRLEGPDDPDAESPDAAERRRPASFPDPRLELAADPDADEPNPTGPLFAAAERPRPASRLDPRTDVWALGVILYELLEGRPPFSNPSFPELCANVIARPVPPLSRSRPNVPPAVEQAVLRCLQRSPDARFASIADMARALSPYGTRLARASLDRIEHGPWSSSRLSDFSLPPLQDAAGSESWPGADDGRAFQTPASARVVVGSFVMLSGLFIGAFMWIYADVHAGEKPAAGESFGRTTPAAAIRPSASAIRPAAPAAITPAAQAPASAPRPELPPTPEPGVQIASPETRGPTVRPALAAPRSDLQPAPPTPRLPARPAPLAPPRPAVQSARSWASRSPVSRASHPGPPAPAPIPRSAAFHSPAPPSAAAGARTTESAGSGSDDNPYSPPAGARTPPSRSATASAPATAGDLFEDRK